MLDTGAQPNLLKIGSLKSNIRVNSKHIVQLTGITEDAVHTLGTAKIRISRVPVSFHVIPDNFPIVQQGILGSSFFTEHNAQINYGAKVITWQNQEFPFKNQESIFVPARTNAGFVIKVSNPEIKTGYLPRLYSTDGVFVGDCVVTCVNGKGYIRAINTTENGVDLLIPTIRLRELAKIADSPLGNNNKAATELSHSPADTNNVKELSSVDNDKAKTPSVDLDEANAESSYSAADAKSIKEEHLDSRDEKIESRKSVKTVNLKSIRFIDQPERVNRSESVKPVKTTSTNENEYEESSIYFKKHTTTSSGYNSSDDLAESFQLLFAQRSKQEGSTGSNKTLTESRAAPGRNDKSPKAPSTFLNNALTPVLTISESIDSPPHSRSESLNRPSRDLPICKGSASMSPYPRNSASLNNLPPFRAREIIDLLRLDHLNEEERENIRVLVSNHADRFHIPGDFLDKTQVTSHRITTTDDVPIHVRQYRFPPIHKDEIVKQVSELITKQIVKPSNSPYNSPVWIVPKKADSHGNKRWRMVIDYRKLNEKSVGDAYPLPNICDILDQLGGAKYFSVLDLASGFHQIPMHPDDACKTAFSTPHGHFQFERMPFGLKNAPATFQRLMDQILTGLQGVELFVYMDDIVVYACSLQEHDNKMKILMNRLREANLQLQPDKCEFLRREVAYLGHIIGENGIRPNPEKLRAIREFPAPRNQKNIRQFLGLAGYYRRFIPSFSDISKSLTKLLKKDVPFDWTTDQQKSFDVLKNALCCEPILQYPDFSRPFVLTTDASKFAIGGVLSQGPIGQDLPIAYASRILESAEINYSTIEKELLAINYCTHHFRPYLYGRKFTLVTDHRPLVWLYHVKDPTSRLMRWRLKLEEYDYIIIYKSGLSNKNADALSRNPPINNNPEGNPPEKELITVCPINKKKRLETECEFPSADMDTESDSETDEPRARPRKINIRLRVPTQTADDNAPIATRLRSRHTLEPSLETDRPPPKPPHVSAPPSRSCTPPTSLDDVPLNERTSCIPLPPSSSQTETLSATEDCLPPDSSDNEHGPPAHSGSDDSPHSNNGATLDPSPTTTAPHIDDPASSVPRFYVEDENSPPSPETTVSEESELSSEHELDSCHDSETFPQNPPASLLVKESRDDLLAPRDNMIIMTTVDGQPFDAGARLLAKRNRLPALEDLTLGRGKVIGFEDTRKHLIILPVKERRSTLLDFDILVEAFRSLLDIVRELNIKTFSIAKSDVLDDFTWLAVRTKLENIFSDERVMITICPGLTIVPPESDRLKIIAEYHASAFGGHKGVTKTYRRIRQEYNWPNLKAQVRDYVAQCRTCQLKKLVRLKTRQPMILTDTPGAAFDKVALDFVGPLPRSRHDKIYLLTMQDLLTKYSVAVPLAHITAEATAAAFVNHFICRFGCPRAILTDQGTNFTSRVMKEIAKQFDIEHVTTTAFHPQSNGSLERSHHVLYEYIKCFIGTERCWDTIIERAMFAYNTSVHEGTLFTPHELVFGRTARMPSTFCNSPPLDTYPSYLTDLFNRIHNLQQTARANLERAKLKSKAYYDRRVNEQNYQVGDNVYLLTHSSSKFADQYTGPHEILEILPDGNIRIRVRNSSKIVHPNRCRISRITEPGR